MHILSIFVDGAANPFQLRYRGAEQAAAARKRLVEATAARSGEYKAPVETLTFQDDYGQTLELSPWKIGPFVLQDILQDIAAQVALHRLRLKGEQELATPSGLVVPQAGPVFRQ